MGVLNYVFAPGVGNSPIKKISQGGWSGLELTDTLLTYLKAEIFSEYCLFNSNMEDRYTI